MPEIASKWEVWIADLNPVVGTEQAGTRPCLVVSSDGYNHSAAERVVVLPITDATSKGGKPKRRIAWHVGIPKGEAGCIKDSLILSDQPRTISTQRLRSRKGEVTAASIKSEVEQRLRLLLDHDE